jgi:hypothetical protein
MAFVIVEQDIVGFLDGLELDFGILSFVFGDFVWVACKSGLSRRSANRASITETAVYLSIGLSNIVFRRAPLDS